MEISNISYDRSTGTLTLVGKADHETAVAFLVGGQALPAALASEISPDSAKPAKEEKPAAKATPVEDEAEDDDDDEAEDDDDDEDDEAEEAQPTAAPAAKSKLKITDKMRGATKLREIIEELITQGVSKKDMLAACRALKEKVPVLGRVADLDARVPKAYEMITTK